MFDSSVSKSGGWNQYFFIVGYQQIMGLMGRYFGVISSILRKVANHWISVIRRKEKASIRILKMCKYWKCFRDYIYLRNASGDLLSSHWVEFVNIILSHFSLLVIQLILVIGFINIWKARKPINSICSDLQRAMQRKWKDIIKIGFQT